MTAATALSADLTSTLRLTPPQDAPTEMGQVPWTCLRRSDFNPRRTHDDRPLFELAVDIYHKGILQNLVVRPHPTEDGAYEIAAGERRYRALSLLVEGLELVDDEGGESTFLKVPENYTVPVLIRPLTDVQLLEVAITENLQREDVLPLEEADGFSHLAGLGMKPDEIAARSGRSVRLVEQRLTLAAGLGQEGRKLLLGDKINLAQAQAISQTSGELKKHLLKLVKDNPHAYSAEQLRKMTTQGRVLVSNALFDVQASGLGVCEDLWGMTPAYFRDNARAQALQLAAIEALVHQDRESGRWAFVDVVPCSAHNNVRSLPWNTYRSSGAHELRGVVFIHGPSGEMHRHEGVVREDEARAAEKAARVAHRLQASTTRAPEDRPVREVAHRIAQEARARVLWGTLVTDPKRCLALTVQGLFERAGEVKVHAEVAPSLSVPLPEIAALVTYWTTKRPDLFQTHQEGTMVSVLRGADFHDALMGLMTDGLLELLAYHSHDQIHHWTTFSATARPGALAIHVAGQIGADGRLAQEWQVTADYLNAHTVPQLMALIATMPGKARPAVTPTMSKKELVGRIVEVAGMLREAGWVPDVVKFSR